MPATDGASMTIGTFSGRSRLSVKALRLYDKIGLLVPATVDERSGYRYYQGAQLDSARLIASLRAIGMPLSEVAAVLTAATTSNAAADRLVAAYWASVERRTAAQRALVNRLHQNWTGEDTVMTNTTWGIAERDVPQRTLLSEHGHVGPGELPEFIGSAIGRLMTLNESTGAPQGVALAIYHGRVDEDSDGPVEVAVQVDPAAWAERQPETSGVRLRIEPAHRERFIRLTRAQVVHPHILTAFEAVGADLERDGLAMAAPPREVYFTDFAAAGPDDDVCDVAFPLTSG